MTSRNHRSAPGASDLQLIPPLGKDRPHLRGPDSPHSDTKHEIWKEKGKPASRNEKSRRPAIKPEPKPQGKSPSEGGGEPGSNPPTETGSQARR